MFERDERILCDVTFLSAALLTEFTLHGQSGDRALRSRSPGRSPVVARGTGGVLHSLLPGNTAALFERSAYHAFSH